jgi:predicted membrane-bound dolichyl-phosphate-mannose-protein mannosyltransferase
MQCYVGGAVVLAGIAIAVGAFVVQVAAGIYVHIRRREISMTFWPAWSTVCGTIGFLGVILIFIGRFILENG